MTKYWLVEVAPARLLSRCHIEPFSCTDMSIAGVTFHRAGQARSACSRAASTINRRRKSRNNGASSGISGPPTNPHSAAGPPAHRAGQQEPATPSGDSGALGELGRLSSDASPGESHFTPPFGRLEHGHSVG